MTRSALTQRARAAARARMRQDLLAAVEEHGGDLDLVAEDPRIRCDRRNLYHYAREAGIDLGAVAGEQKRLRELRAFALCQCPASEDPVDMMRVRHLPGCPKEKG
jgi:hypothetical protein